MKTFPSHRSQNYEMPDSTSAQSVSNNPVWTTILCYILPSVSNERY